MTTAESIARPSSYTCAGGCKRVWNHDHQWITCWCCKGSPLGFCPECGAKHFASPACRAAHGKGAEGAA